MVGLLRYTAVSRWTPADSAVVRIAVPPFRGALPNCDEPSMKITLPVRFGSETVAVRVVGVRELAGFADELRVIPTEGALSLNTTAS